MTYRDDSVQEGWDFDKDTPAGKRFLEMKAEHVLAATDFYGLTNQEIGYFFIAQGVMTRSEFYNVFGKFPE